MRVLKTGVLPLFCVLWALTPAAAQYFDEVLEDEPFAYWRLGEGDVFDAAFNSAETATDPLLLDGTYVGGVLLEEEPLIFNDDDPAARFNGIDTQVDVPDSAFTNAGGPYQARTVELWFNADVIDTRGMLFEGGGTTRGLAIWVEEVDGIDTLSMSMWNRSEESWQPVVVSTEIEEGVTYHAVMVHDASENDTFGDFDGRITGYLDGEEFDTALGADQLYNHGDDYAIGAVRQNTYYPDGSNPGNGDFFTGVIDEVACYSYALDDPDDDGDFGDSRIMDHYLAGSQPRVTGCPSDVAAAVDGADVRLTWTKGGETAVRVVRNGVELAAAAPVTPPVYIDANPPPGALNYELTFTLPGEDCTVARRVDACISNLAVANVDGNIELQWQNGKSYAGIVIQRGADVIATIGGDETSYVDVDPPDGSWTYSVSPQNGDCDPAAATAVVLTSNYANVVLGDGALAYWSLGEDDGSEALNAGSAGRPLDAMYAGGIELGRDSLVRSVPDNLAVGFDGIDATVAMPDSTLTNTGGPFEAKTIELWFQAELIDEEPRIIFEEGGTTNGFNIYVQEVEGESRLYMVAWSAGQGWDSVGVSAEIEVGEAYHAIMVFDSSENEFPGDFDGRVTGYLNGSEIDTALGADLMNNHDNDGALGAVNGGETQLLDNTDKTSGGFFVGVIDDVSLYDVPLDDPDDDGDFSDSRVLAHLAAGLGAENCALSLQAVRDGQNIRLSWTPGMGQTSVRVERDGVLLAAAAPVDPPEYIDSTAAPGLLEYSLTFDSPGCPVLTRRFDACITDLTAQSGARSAELSWVNQLGYTEIVVLRDDDIIATIGGDQTSYTDTDAPTGPHTYAVAPTNGDCEPTTVDVVVFESAYPGAVLADGAEGYWRLDDEDDLTFAAQNLGNAGVALDGTYLGSVLLENESLLPATTNASVLFEGIDGSLTVPNHDTINLGGPFTAATIECWFRADVIDVEPRVIYEQGGATRGLSIYVHEVDGDPLLFMCGWNLAQEQWGVLSVSAEIEPEVAYHAVMVFDASENATFGDFDGRITGYLDGEEFDTAIGADRLYEHTGAIGIGAPNGATVLADGSAPAGGFFAGSIDEFATYTIALDDPNGDENLDDSRVMAHYLAGTDGGGPVGATLKPGDINGDGNLNIADMVAQLNFLFGGGGGVPECYLVPGSDALNETGLAIFDYNGDGSNNIADAVAGLGGLFGGGGPHFLGEGCTEIEGSCESNCLQ